MGKNTGQAQQWLENEKCYSDSAPSKRKICLVGGRLISNMVALIQMMQNAWIGQMKH